MSRPPLEPVAKLSDDHQLDGFDCGNEDLNTWLQKYALQSQRSRGAVTWVLCRAEQVVGYYALAAHQVVWRDAPERMTEGLGRYPVPAVLLAKLALDEREQGQGLGTDLLRDALRRSLGAADEIGARAVVVDAKDDETADFYRRHDFEAFEDEPHRMYVLMKDLAPLVADALEEDEL